jgi:hypothetical protein
MKLDLNSKPTQIKISRTGLGIEFPVLIYM